MEKEAFIELVEANPVVAAIKDDDGLKRCLESDIDVVFVLYGDVISIRDIVHRLKKGNKTVLVHEKKSHRVCEVAGHEYGASLLHD